MRRVSASFRRAAAIGMFACLASAATGDGPRKAATSARPHPWEPIAHPVVRTHSFPLGIDYGPASSPYCHPWPILPGGGIAIDQGYPFGLSITQLTAGRAVRVPVSWWWRTPYQTRPLVERERRVDPSQAYAAHQPPPQAPAPVAPPIDDGVAALRASEWDRAIAVYFRRDAERRDLESRSEVAPPADRTALRLAALALAGAGRHGDAELVLTRAMEEDPRLVSRPIRGDEVLGSRDTARRLVIDAVKHARSTGRPASWELVAMLMEAEGRPAVAQRMRQRAEAIARGPAATPPASPAPAPERSPSFRMPPVVGETEPR